MRDARLPATPGSPGVSRLLRSALTDEAISFGAEDEDEAASARPQEWAVP